MTSPLLQVSDVKVQIGAVEILHGVDLHAHPGQLVAIVGPNGAGKSTLARAAAGIQHVSAGSVRWQAQDTRHLSGRRLARLRAFVPQRPRVPQGLSVLDAVSLGRAPHIGPLRRATRHDHDAVAIAMQRTGVSELVHRRLTTLSGGELQRAQIAVALAQEAPALIADEPTSHLDLGAAAQVAQLLRDLADVGLAVVVVLHDLAIAAAIADTVLVMAGGRADATGTPSEVLDSERLASVWGVQAALETHSDGHTALRVSWLG